MQTFLNVFAPIAVIIFATGIALNLGRWLKALTMKRRFRGVTQDFEGGPSYMNPLAAAKSVLFDPMKHFYKKANPTWNRGYLFYHLAIITEVLGYSLAAVIVFFHVLMGNHVPDVAAHAEHSLNYTPANLIAIIFGNGEHLQAQFLFGGLGDVFIYVTWVAVICAVIGNMHLVYTILRGRGASTVLGDIDQAAAGIRTKGTLKWDRILVRLLIFTIIWTELLARLEVVPGIVFFHGALGLILFTVFPFTYLFHMVYNLVALFYSSRRRMARTVA